MRSYEETANDFHELVGLGYSVKEAIEMIEDGDANETALKELKYVQQHGI